MKAKKTQWFFSEKAINYFFLGYKHSQFIGYQNPISWDCFSISGLPRRWHRSPARNDRLWASSLWVQSSSTPVPSLRANATRGKRATRSLLVCAHTGVATRFSCFGACVSQSHPYSWNSRWYPFLLFWPLAFLINHPCPYPSSGCKRTVKDTFKSVPWWAKRVKRLVSLTPADYNENRAKRRQTTAVLL